MHDLINIPLWCNNCQRGSSRLRLTCETWISIMSEENTSEERKHLFLLFCTCSRDRGARHSNSSGLQCNKCFANCSFSATLCRMNHEQNFSAARETDLVFNEALELFSSYNPEYPHMSCCCKHNSECTTVEKVKWLLCSKLSPVVVGHATIALI